MNRTTLARRIGAVALGAAVVTLVVASCGKNKIIPTQVGNLSPTVRLTSAPIDTSSENFYSITLNWVGYDQDGRVDHYEFAIDPPEQAGAETTWTFSNENEKRLTFSAGTRVVTPNGDSKSRDFHTFVIAAVDDRGAIGPRIFRSFFTYTVAPTVVIESPAPSSLLNPLLPPSVRITWSGQDVDGVFTTRPVYYKYLLVNSGKLPPGITTIDQLITDPSLFRTIYAPDFPDSQGTPPPRWVRTSAESTTVQFTDLNPGEQYVFVVVAFDEAGAYSPVFSLNSNVLRFKVGFAGTRGPRICMFNEFFFYCYPSGGYTVDPRAERRIEVPEGQLVRFFWFAEPPEGASIRCTRWLLDGDVFDETPRSDELTDTKHWSTCSGTAFTATVGPFFANADASSSDHYFYIEAQDNIGLKSLGIIHFNVIRATLDRPMLIVDDTRLAADRLLSNGNWDKPKGRWPTAAELDTFLYARGGNDWNFAYESTGVGRTRPTVGPYPRGTLTTPGLFNGYAYDTLGTRNGRNDLTVPLSVLGKYKHVIWLVDGLGATFNAAGTDGTHPQTALRYMSSAGRVNNLAALVKQGGLVWLTGGGGAYANLIPNNYTANDHPTITFSNITGGSTRELHPGRMMFDVAKWQSEIRTASAPTKPIRNLGRLRNNPGLYALLPDSLQPKSPLTDPLPPTRNGSDFYVSSFDFEFLQQENVYSEPIRTDPVDFVIDTFNESDPTQVARRWISSDTLNTRVSQDPVGQTGHAMQIATQGGGASVGDRVARTFDPPKDWSGLVALRFAIKQSQSAGALQWRVRIVDDQGASIAALVPVTATGRYEQMDLRITRDGRVGDFVTDSPTQPRLVAVSRLEFEAVTAATAATTSIDQVAVAMTFDAPVLDTLYSGAGGGSTTLPANNAAMTYYHGHDSVPFMFSGFSIWMYRRAECQQLIDFVLQRLWGMSKSGGAPALRSRGITPARAVSTVARPGPSRTSPPPRGAGKVTAAERTKIAPGTRK